MALLARQINYVIEKELDVSKNSESEGKKRDKRCEVRFHGLVESRIRDFGQ